MQDNHKYAWLPDGEFMAFLAMFTLLGAGCWIWRGPNPVSIICAFLVVIMLLAWCIVDVFLWFSELRKRHRNMQ